MAEGSAAIVSIWLLPSIIADCKGVPTAKACDELLPEAVGVETRLPLEADICVACIFSAALLVVGADEDSVVGATLAKGIELTGSSDLLLGKGRQLPPFVVLVARDKAHFSSPDLDEDWQGVHVAFLRSGFGRDDVLGKIVEVAEVRPLVSAFRGHETVRDELPACFQLARKCRSREISRTGMRFGG
jgi:hypothetical protein